MYDMLKTKKCSDVDTPQRKRLRQVRIEFKIASSNWMEILRHRPFPYKVNAPFQRINFWCEFSFNLRKDAVATFSDDVITTRPRKHFSSGG